MTYGQQQQPFLVRLGHALHRYFYAEKALTNEGVGGNVTEGLFSVARSIDRLAAAQEAELAWMRDRFGDGE
jgi:hypothetical protein